MERYKLRIKVFKNTEDDKRTLQNIVQDFIHSNSDDCELAVVRSVGQDGSPILEEFFSRLGFNMDRNASTQENLSREDILDRVDGSRKCVQGTMPEMTFRLYNCDETYDLDKVEALIKTVAAKRSRKATIEKNYFSIPQMNELCSKLEDVGRQPGYAVFVVHANEPGLVINSHNPRAGYSKVYRTLLRLTDNRVLIVIGGDDNYKDQGERDKLVLSRWAWHKICPQFNKKYMNGMKSFIFSWDESHHPIHEEALEFYLDPKKKEQEFVPISKTKPSIALPKDDEQNDLQDSGEKQLHSFKPNSQTPETPEGARVSKTVDFLVLSFYSKKESVSTVERLLGDVCNKLSINSKLNCPSDLHPSDFPQHIKDNNPDYIVLVTEMHDFKNVDHLESWVKLYKDILKSVKFVADKRLIFLVCGDPDCKDGNLSSDLVQEQFSKLNSGVLPSGKITIMSWSAKPCTLHQDALICLLNPPKPRRKDESRISKERAESDSWPAEAEIDHEKGRLRYRALIRHGQVDRVLKAHPTGWKPEDVMVEHLLDKHKDLFRGFLEFWEKKDGSITAVVTDERRDLFGMHKAMIRRIAGLEEQ